MVSVLHVSIVDLEEMTVSQLEARSCNLFRCADLAAALTARVTERPERLNRAIDTQMAAEIPAILGSLIICL